MINKVNSSPSFTSSIDIIQKVAGKADVKHLDKSQMDKQFFEKVADMVSVLESKPGNSHVVTEPMSSTLLALIKKATNMSDLKFVSKDIEVKNVGKNIFVLGDKLPTDDRLLFKIDLNA